MAIRILQLYIISAHANYVSSIFSTNVFLKVQLDLTDALFSVMKLHTIIQVLIEDVTQAQRIVVIDQLCRELSVMTFWPKVWPQCVKCYFQSNKQHVTGVIFCQMCVFEL